MAHAGRSAGKDTVYLEQVEECAIEDTPPKAVPALPSSPPTSTLRAHLKTVARSKQELGQQARELKAKHAAVQAELGAVKDQHMQLQATLAAKGKGKAAKRARRQEAGAEAEVQPPANVQPPARKGSAKRAREAAEEGAEVQPPAKMQRPAQARPGPSPGQRPHEMSLADALHKHHIPTNCSQDTIIGNIQKRHPEAKVTAFKQPFTAASSDAEWVYYPSAAIMAGSPVSCVASGGKGLHKCDQERGGVGGISVVISAVGKQRNMHDQRTEELVVKYLCGRCMNGMRSQLRMCYI